MLASLATSALYVSTYGVGSKNTPKVFVSKFEKTKKIIVKKEKNQTGGYPAIKPFGPAAEKVKITKQKSKPLKNNIKYLVATNKEIEIEEVKIERKELKVKELNKVVIDSSDESPINNEELINHYGFKINNEVLNNKISWTNYFSKINLSRKLASLNEGEGPTLEKQNIIQKEDLKQKQLEIEKIQRIAKRENNKDIEDFVQTVASQKVDTQITTEMEFYDYSKSGESENSVELANDINIKRDEEREEALKFDVVLSEENKKINSVPDAAQFQKPIISKNVMDVVNREMGISPKMAMLTKSVSTHNKRKNEYSKIIDLIKKKKSAVKKMNTQTSGYSKTIYTAYEVELGSKSLGNINSFELASAHDGNERFSDHNNGHITFEEELASPRGVKRATLLKRGYMRTNSDLVLEPGTIEVTIPAITQSSMVDFLNSQELSGQGGFLLVDRDKGIHSLEIDSEYEAKFEMDDNFNLITKDSDVRFVLFVGVYPGNTLLKVRTIDSEYSEKIVHIVEDEVQFEALLLDESVTKKFSVLERTILASNPNELTIAQDKIGYFNRKENAVQLASNLYEMKMPIVPLGMRRYLEFKHLDETIYVGMSNNSTSLELPSKDFIVNLLEANDMQGMEGRCLIQINLKKSIQKMVYTGESVKGPMGMDRFYLEKNGSLSEEETQLTSKVFLLGDYQGIVNVRLDYVDGSKDYLQTFCSTETYLVEQL